MNIVVIYPGFARCGFAVIKVDNKKASVLDIGCIEPEVNINQEFKLEKIFDQLSKISKEFNPELLGIEKVFFNKNAKTVINVGSAIGVVKLVGAKNKMEVQEYTPLQVKIALTGYGRAEKKQVEKMIQNIFKLDTSPFVDDAIDALAVAYTVGVHSGLL